MQACLVALDAIIQAQTEVAVAQAAEEAALVAAAVALAAAELVVVGKFAYLRSKFHYPLQILKFARVLDCMRCKALSHVTSNVVGVRGLLRGKGATS